MSRRQTGEQHDRLLRELNEERAAALMRISRTLESLIDQLRTLRERLVTPSTALGASGDADRTRELAVYRELRRLAIRYRWYLEVQREALGLRHHHALDEFYAIPGPLEP